jgi:hypothetical protein
MSRKERRLYDGRPPRKHHDRVEVVEGSRLFVNWEILQIIIQNSECTSHILVKTAL